MGETLAEREAGQTEAVITRQVRGALAGFPADAVAAMVLAYEPVWAIGTGKAATPEEANRVVKDIIRATLADLFGAKTAEAVRVLYGGSVKPHNAAPFFAQPDIDGALVGGASLKADQFVAIAAAAAENA